MPPDGPRPVALITGAARRIGRAIALEMAAADHDVAVHWNRSVDEGSALVDRLRDAGCRAHGFTADLTDREAVRRFAADVVEHFGRVDVLVNNASVFHPTRLADTDADGLAGDVDRFLAVHVAAPLELIRALAPALGAHGAGAVVNLGDADLVRPGFAPYVASKAALAALTRSLAVELAPEIRVNMVAPGAILPAAGAAEGEEERLSARVPLRRLGSPEEVARTVRFLVTGPGFVSGQVIAVDGAQHV